MKKMYLVELPRDYVVVSAESAQAVLDMFSKDVYGVTEVDDVGFAKDDMGASAGPYARLNGEQITPVNGLVKGRPTYDYETLFNRKPKETEPRITDETLPF